MAELHEYTVFVKTFKAIKGSGVPLTMFLNITKHALVTLAENVG